MPTLTAKSIKATIVLDASELVAMPDPVTPRVVLTIQLPDRTVTADIAAKSVRKAIATIDGAAEAGAALILQGKLVGYQIVEAGLVAQPRQAKAAA